MNEALARKLRESLRLTLLELMLDQESRGASDKVLSIGLQALGQPTLQETIRGELALLQRMGLVSLERLTETMWVAKLTERGEMCARGDIIEPGVARPRLA